MLKNSFIGACSFFGKSIRAKVFCILQNVSKNVMLDLVSDKTFFLVQCIKNWDLTFFSLTFCPQTINKNVQSWILSPVTYFNWNLNKILYLKPFSTHAIPVGFLVC